MCDAREGAISTTRPRWSRLYGIWLFATVAFALAEFGTAEGPARATLELGLVLAAYGAMAWWVRASRAALDQLDRCACASGRITVRVVMSWSRHPLRPSEVAPLSVGSLREAHDQSQNGA